MIKKMASIVLSAALLIPPQAFPLAAGRAADSGTMRDITTFDIVQEMGIGINLGNTFESSGDWIAQYGDGSVNSYETAWGSPTITKDIIKGYADEGFGVLRVPVAWSNLMSNDGKYTISKEYKARVRQVIDWALDEDMYVIMNLHWDGGWLENLPNDHDNCMKKYTAIWTQLCDEFKGYGDKLMFEAQNEELYWQNVWNQWGGTNGKDKAYGYCNEVNQAFVDIVRKSGGNNSKRHLLISGYNTDVKLTCDPMFKMPSDPAGRCAVSVHYYIPSTFAILEEDADWGKCSRTWGSSADMAELSGNMDLLKATFVDKGVPVIIGEYGCPTKNKDSASVTKYLSSVCEQAVKRGGICPVLWDITNLHYDRVTCKIKDRQLKANFDNIRSTYCKAKTPQTTTQPIQTTQPVQTALGGTLIKSLIVNDSENASDWSVQSGLKVGDKVYGDRDITVSDMPAELTGAEVIRTACDSKMYTGQLASFTAGEDIAVYAAVDSRVNSRLDWLKSWTDTGAAVTTSNNVQLELFRKTAKSGESVELGTNGGEGESANYIVFALPLAADKPVTTSPAGSNVWGDSNCDGKVTAADAVAILQFISNSDRYSLTDDGRYNADVYNNGDGITARDALSIQMFDANMLPSLPESYSSTPAATMTTTTIPMTTTTVTTTTTTAPKSLFNYNANLQYKKAPDSYRRDCAQQGKVEKVTYKTTVYSKNLDKSAYVYLPYGYDPNKQYNIMYMMHGGGGNENSIFIESTVMKKYLDSMIMNGDIDPMIVVTPTFNNAAGSDMTANAKNFWNELAKDVVPAVESKYSTYAKSTSPADLKASRGHRAFSGFSMGSLTTWYVFLNDLDYFEYCMPLSGDCWAGNTADQKAQAVADAAKKSGYAKNEYFLMCATGTKDIAYGAMNDQINSMKKLTDTFTYTSNFSKGNLYFLLCDGGSHWWDGYIVDYIYDAMPYLFHE